MIANRELDLLINETDPVDNEAHCTTEPGKSMTPLARLRQRIADQDRTFVSTDEVLGMIEQVGDETGTETAPVDPLTDGIFQAQQEFDEVLNDG